MVTYIGALARQKQAQTAKDYGNWLNDFYGQLVDSLKHTVETIGWVMARHPLACNREGEIDLEHLLLLYEQHICIYVHILYIAVGQLCAPPFFIYVSHPTSSQPLCGRSKLNL